MKPTAKNKVYKAIYASDTVSLTKIIKYKLEKVLRVEPSIGLVRYRLITENGEGYYVPGTDNKLATKLTQDIVEAINNGTVVVYASCKAV
ncbi:hypothetical protein XI20_23095 [Salmonella enterica subsp. enterica serovar Montevideo]|nr:hypothetical protein [Salmonella enterica subsp. enterica serovar Typhimurium]EEA0533956.1 hypothetical protein [Salmonella enterica subsp. enterica serovar Montevideo]